MPVLEYTLVFESDVMCGSSSTSEALTALAHRVEGAEAGNSVMAVVCMTRTALSGTGFSESAPLYSRG